MERKLLSSLKEHLSKEEFTVISGAWQTGKTTLLRQLQQYLRENGNTCRFLSFEDPEMLAAINQHPEELFSFVPKPDNGRLYVLIDEVQYASNPTNFLKYLYDHYSAFLKVIATGSSAFYIDKNSTDSLAGRKRLFNLYPLDFDEFLTFKDKAELSEEWELMRQRPDYRPPAYRDIKRYLEEYLLFGGYPRVVLEDDPEEKKLILQELVNTFIKKDVEESGIRQEGRFYRMIRLLAEQTGSLLNKHEIGNTLGLSSKTVEHYLYVLRKCFHLHILQPYSPRNMRKELTKMPKGYFNDTGIRNYLIRSFNGISYRPDKGALLENYAFIRLRQLHDSDHIRFWRTADGNEVDFVVEKATESGNAYEVKFNEKEFKPGRYKKFIQSYPEFSLQCLAWEAEDPGNAVMRL